MLLQVVSNFGIVPAVNLLSPADLYNPEFGPSLRLLVALAIASLLPSMTAWLLWRRRISAKAPTEQEREAEAEFTADV